MPEDDRELEIVDLGYVQSELSAGNHEMLWNQLPSVVRRELLGHAPFGAQWTPRVESVVRMLTEQGLIAIIEPIVTKDSSCE